LALAGSFAAAQTAPAEPKNYSIDPWHLNVPKPVANPATSVTEKIPGSDLSADIIYVRDERRTYSPIAMMKPAGNAASRSSSIAHMNGGAAPSGCANGCSTETGRPRARQGGLRGRVDALPRRGEQLLRPGAEETSRQGRQLFNRGPLEYDDAIAIVKFAKTLPYINADRISG